MPTLYQTIDKRFWLYQPQLTRWRHPYRGPRRSEKINQEINQIYYDLARVMQRSTILNQTIKDLTDKLYNGFDYTGQFTSNNFDVNMLGLNDLASQIEGLRNRIRGLE